MMTFKTILKFVLFVTTWIIIVIQSEPLIAQSTKNITIQKTSGTTINLFVNENYGDIKPWHPAGSQAFKDAKNLLENYGFIIVKEPDQKSDAILEISFIGTPESAIYSGVGRCYTGAGIRGNIILNYKGKSISKKFNGHSPLASAVTKYGNKRPEGAPFIMALENSELSLVLTSLISSTFEIDEIKSLIITLNTDKVDPETTKKIVEIGEPAIPFLLELLKDSTSKDSAKASAAVILGKIGIKDYEAVNTLIALLKIEGKPKLYNRDAAYALGLIGDQRTVDSLIKALNSEKIWCYYRETVIFALGKIGDSQAVIPLKKALEDRNSKCGLKEIPWALGKIGGVEAIEIIIDSLDDERYQVRKGAYLILQEITGKYFNFDIEKDKWKQLWREDKEAFLKKE